MTQLNLSIEGFDHLVNTALSRSQLTSLPEVALKQLLSDSIRSEIPAGRVIYTAGERPTPSLVVFGLLRLFVTSIDGRQITVAYARAGDLLGAIEGVSDGATPVSAQGVTEVRLLRFRAGTIDQILHTQPELGLALARDAVDHLYRLVGELRNAVFGTVRQRLARHLLDLAAENQQGSVLMAPVTQQQLADSVGSVREVVARVLGELRSDGLIISSREGIVVSDPERLRSEGWPAI